MRNKAAISLAAITLAAFAACVDPTRGESGLFCPEDHFEFRIIDNGTAVEITSYVGGRTDVRIPPYIRGLPVTAIGEEAFAGDWVQEVGWVIGHISSVTIPNSVKHIGDGAFAANQLTSVYIPSGVPWIGNWAFAWNQLANVVIPDGITYIGRAAFMSNQLITVTIPDGVTHVLDWAFGGNHLTYVSIPSSVIFIGNEAFAANQLASVVIPNYDAMIAWNAFDDDVLITIGTD